MTDYKLTSMAHSVLWAARSLMDDGLASNPDTPLFAEGGWFLGDFHGTVIKNDDGWLTVIVADTTRPPDSADDYVVLHEKALAHPLVAALQDDDASIVERWLGLQGCPSGVLGAGD